MRNPPKPDDEPLAAEAIEPLLRGLPRWRLDAGGEAIERTWAVTGLWAAAAFGSGLASVVENLGHEATITVTASGVVVALSTTAAGGLTAKDFAVALALEFGG